MVTNSPGFDLGLLVVELDEPDNMLAWSAASCSEAHAAERSRPGMGRALAPAAVAG